MAACISRFRVECIFLGFKLAVQPEIWPKSSIRLAYNCDLSTAQKLETEINRQFRL
jgi:hypothetical protein